MRFKKYTSDDIERTCQQCGQIFIIDKFACKLAKQFCDAGCMFEAKKLFIKICPYCLSEFDTTDLRQKFCCPEHRKAKQQGRTFKGNEVSHYDELKEKYNIESSCELG